jgi:L-iditol 2-dehydrogenase
MKTLRLHNIGDLRLHDEPLPVPGLGESLLRVTSVGICGSDLHWFSEGSTGGAGITQPFILGHEFAGVIAEGECKGQRVAVDPEIPCEVCEFCLEGNPNLCENHHFAGQASDDGALREYLPWPSRYLVPLPDALSDDDGAMLEPLGVAIHSVDLGHLKPGMSVGVYGCGPIGLLILQVARVSGASRIYATDKLPHRLEAAREFGATEVFLASDHGDERPGIMAATDQRGVDVAFEAAGENPAVDAAIQTCKPGGVVALCGIPREQRTSFDAAIARRKGLTIRMVRRMKHTYPRALRLVESGLVDVRSLVSHRFPLEQAEEAFRLAEKRQGLKIIIHP